MPSRRRAPTASASSTPCAVSRSTEPFGRSFRAARSVTQLPIVGMGGVQSGRDALELIACGATHVALGTILFADPFAPRRVRDELVAEAAIAGFDSPDDAFSAAFDTVVKVEN